MATRDDEEVVPRVMELTAGAGVHAVLQTVFSSESMRLSQRCVRSAGTISCVGMEQLAGGAAEVELGGSVHAQRDHHGGDVRVTGYLAGLLSGLADGGSPGRWSRTRCPWGSPDRLRADGRPAEGVVKVALRP